MSTTLFSSTTGDVVVPSNNYTATVDPTVNNDITGGWTPGSFWLNQSNNRIWACQTNTKGAAVWYLDGVVPGVGIEPSSMLTQFGSSTASFPEEGNIYRFVSAGQSPGTINNNNVLAVYTLPANAFDVSGRGIGVMAMGSVANNTNSKTISLVYAPTTAVVGSAVVGGTTIATTGAYTTTGAAAFQLVANIYKYGAAGSNTQVALHETVQVGAVIPALTVPQLLTATESGVIAIAVCGNAVTATTDILLNLFAVNAMN